MEESARVDDTLRIYQRLRAAGHDNVGTVLQSYLYRTPARSEACCRSRPNLRLVKGAYLEPASVAYPEKTDVDRAYIDLAERMLTDRRASPRSPPTTSGSSITCIASRARHGIGTTASSSRCSTASGRSTSSTSCAPATRPDRHPLRPAVVPYLMRRLAERPANVIWFASNCQALVPITTELAFPPLVRLLGECYHR